MKKKLLATIALAATTALAATALADEKGKLDPKKEFEKHCAPCHKDGGNIVNPAKTLKKADLTKNGFKSAKDIVKNMRNPGPGMTKFDEKTISDKEAKAIADYILKTFK